MMDHMTYAAKSPEKSSPSFPEDVEDDDEDPVEMGHLKYPNSTQKILDLPNESELQTDVAMLAEDDLEDDVGGGQTRSFMLGVDSPRHPTDSSEKKVHWSNQNVQVLLDCVERHLDEFNVQKKHKQVWQTIGVEMEPYGFTMEHCYNKWKNLRRDVRLLVNNPQKAVRNADILRRVARLILVIYPNIDATTMQVSGDRIGGGGKSTPNTPGGPGSLPCRVTISNAHHAPDSPLYFGLARAGTPQSLTPGFHTFTPNGVKHKSDQTIYESSVPGTALFTNLQNSDNDTKNNGPINQNNGINNNNHSENGSLSDTNSTNQNSNFPFFFNPAAAALLVQSQLFNDLLRQQQQQQQSVGEESPQLDSVQQREQLLASSNGTKPSLCTNPTANILNNGDCVHDNDLRQSVTLASVLLNGLPNVDLSQLPGLTITTESPLNNSSAVDRLPPGSELAGVVERLRNEETVHLRLADMVTHLADELRAAGMRRRATLDQLLEIMQGSRIQTILGQTAKATDTSHRV